MIIQNQYPNYIYITMEYIKYDISLKPYINIHKNISQKKKIIIKNYYLEYLLNKQIYNRDIKPENINKRKDLTNTLLIYLLEIIGIFY